MNISLTCRACGSHHTPQLDALARWRCPACQSGPEARAAEDFASALEDAAAQLWWLSQAVDLEVELSTHNIPPDFVPAGKASAS